MTPRDLVLTSRGVRHRGRLYPCVIGRGGLSATKLEGDGATPIGSHEIVEVLYRPDRLTAPNSWASPILSGDLWSDDVALADYNQPVRIPYKGSHEVMRRADPMYDIVLVTDWNYPEVSAGLGSCIFLHQWRRPGFPTAGCVAFRRDHLIEIASRLHPGDRLIVPPLPAGPRHAPR